MRQRRHPQIAIAHKDELVGEERGLAHVGRGGALGHRQRTRRPIRSASSRREAVGTQLARCCRFRLCVGVFRREEELAQADGRSKGLPRCLLRTEAQVLGGEILAQRRATHLALASQRLG